MQISNELSAISRSMRQKRDRYMEPMGLRGVHGRLLMDVSENPGITQDNLAQKVRVDKSNIARHMALLEQKELIRRETDPADRRILRLYVTEQAAVLLPKLQKMMEDWEKTVLQDLSHWEISQLMSLLTRVRQSIEEVD